MHNKKRMFVSFFLVITMVLQMFCVMPAFATESFSAELKVKTIVTGLAANLPIDVSKDVIGDVTVKIFEVEKVVTDGYIKLSAAEVPSVINATDFPVTATANSVTIPLGNIRVTTLPTDIWVMSADAAGEDIVLTFGAIPNLDKIQVLLNGKAISFTAEGSGNIVRIAKELVDGNNTIAVKGVRFPEFFPSFSFTYSAQVEFSVPEPDGFGLVYYGKAADIYVDEKDYPGIIHAAENLTKDIALVTDVKAQFKSNADGLSQYAVIAGAIGKSPVIDKLIEDGKLDVSAIKGKWESYVIDYIDNPVPGVSRGLVIAGSDMRGTVFGIYKISETIGVSAWSFFADSVPVHRDALVLPTKSIVQGEPSVKYRGIFINDERSLDRWMNQYARANGHTPPKYDSRGAYWFTHEFYVEVFDMILRQYGNYLWPAMWNNSFWADDPLNGQLATDYGIVIGTTHQEFMNCPDKEWVWSNLGNFQWINPSYPEPENWVYTNRDAMIKKWTETMESTKNFESVVNMGLRGLNDVAIFPSGTKDQNIALLNDVIKEQRKIIENVHGTTDIPQSVIIYKEVESFYWGDNAADPASGWKASIADDITTILCDDNHGNVRGLPMDLNRNRSGGYGMYYHFDYNGAPRSYRWVDATPLEKIREQMTMAYDYGIQRIWVTNVGDLKFNEPPIDYWFKLAYDIEKWGALDGPDIAHEDFAKMQFGEELGGDIAEIIFDYTYMNNVRKPEIVFGNTFSHTSFNEFENMHAKYTDIARKALEIKKEIPAERMDAYYNLVLHPTLVSWNAWNLAYHLGKNQIYQGLGISAVNDYEQIVRASLAFDNFIYQYIYGDPRIMDATYPTVVNTIKTWLGPIVGDNIIDADENGYYCVGDGKYYGYYPRRALTEPFALVADSSIYYLLLTAWNHPTVQKTFTTTGSAHNRLYTLTVPETSEMVVLPQAWLGTALPNAKTGSVDLHKFTNFGDETRFIDIATTGSTSFDYTATANNDWIVLSKNSGTLSTGNKVDRFYVTVDWTKVPAAGVTGSITISGADAAVTVNVTAEVFDTSALPNKTFIENDGYISILSKNFAKSVPATKNGISYEWTELPNYGRVLSSMKVMPNDPNAGYGNARIPGEDAPYLEYNVYIKTPGAIDIITQWAPTNGNDARQLTTLDYAVSLGNEEPKRTRALARNFYVNNAGSILWADGAEEATRTVLTRNNGGACMSAHEVTAPGVYTIRIYMVNDGLTLQKILVGTNSLPRTTVAAANNLTDTMTGLRYNEPAFTAPTLLLGNRSGYNNTVAGTAATASSNGMLSSYFGPPESFCTKVDASLTWVGTWASGQYYGDTAGADSGVNSAGRVALTLPNATLRQLIRPALGGSELRLTFSNEYGATPMTINAASIAKANGENNTSNIDVSTNTAITFNGGSTSVVIQPGEFVTSDIIHFPVAALERVAVSTYFGEMPIRVSSHIAARGNSYIQPESNAILNETLTGTTNTHWFVLCNVDVLASSASKSIVTFGDSITDGYGVSNEQYTRWGDALMTDLQGNPATSHLSVINMGIGTNSLLNGTNPLSARGRFERDVLNQPGVGYVVFQMGVNDLPGNTQTAANMIAAYEGLFEAAAAKGIKVYAGTVSPRGSTVTQDANRQTVNNWMRQQYAEGKVYGLADFDLLLRNPDGQNNILPLYRNDSIHPNAVGYKAMGDYIYSLILEDLNLAPVEESAIAS